MHLQGNGGGGKDRGNIIHTIHTTGMTRLLRLIIIDGSLHNGTNVFIFILNANVKHELNKTP